MRRAQLEVTLQAMPVPVTLCFMECSMSRIVRQVRCVCENMRHPHSKANKSSAVQTHTQGASSTLLLVYLQVRLWS
jgi:hypothetical protein